jgi:hypothetical protein
MAIKMNQVDRKAARGILKKLTTHLRPNSNVYVVYFEQDDGSFERLTARDDVPQVLDAKDLKGRNLLTIYLEIKE